MTDSGNATVLAAGSVGIAVGLATLLVALIVAMTARVETETAADAAALAAVGAAVAGEDPLAAATRLGAANGGLVVMCRCPVYAGTSFVATVVVERAISLPLVGERVLEVARSAEYQPPG